MEMNPTRAKEILNSLIDEGMLAGEEVQAVLCLCKYIKQLESGYPELAIKHPTKCCRTCKYLVNISYGQGFSGYSCNNGHGAVSSMSSCDDYEVF